MGCLQLVYHLMVSPRSFSEECISFLKRKSGSFGQNKQETSHCCVVYLFSIRMPLGTLIRK